MATPTSDVLVARAWEKWLTNYSQAQRNFLMALPMISGSLSVMGSGLILLMLNKRGNLKDLPDRIFTVKSAVDIVVSFWNIFGAFAVPSETGAPLAKGTWATCNAAGFFTNFMYTGGFYNVFFLLYVLLRIRYKLQEHVISNCLERYMHTAAFLFPLLSGTLAIVYQAYNPLGAGFRRCYVAPYPPSCKTFRDGEMCTRGGDFNISALLIYTPTAILLATFIILIVMIFTTAQSTFRQSSQFFSGRRGSRASCDLQSNNTQASVSNNQIAMARQSIMFGIFFFNTYVWTVLLPAASTTRRSMGHDPSPPYWMSVCFESFWPLQGFCNFILFSQFRFRHIRRARKDMSIFWVMKETILGAPITSYKYHRRQSLRISNNNNNNDVPVIGNNNVNANQLVSEDINAPSASSLFDTIGSLHASGTIVVVSHHSRQRNLSEGTFGIGDFELFQEEEPSYELKDNNFETGTVADNDIRDLPINNTSISEMTPYRMGSIGSPTDEGVVHIQRCHEQNPSLEENRT